MGKKTSILLTDDDIERIQPHYQAERTKKRAGQALSNHGFIRWLMRLGLDVLDGLYVRKA